MIYRRHITASPGCWRDGAFVTRWDAQVNARKLQEVYYSLLWRSSDWQFGRVWERDDETTYGRGLNIWHEQTDARLLSKARRLRRVVDEYRRTHYTCPVWSWI